MTFGSLSASAYFEHGSIRFRSYEPQLEIPIEMIVDTGFGEATLGLEPNEVRQIAHCLLEATGECERGDDEPS